MRERRFEIGRKIYRVKALRVGQDMWFHADGQTHFVEGSSTTTRRLTKSADAANSGIIIAPMPGKILKINAKVGAPVHARQVLVVMEAMKMEYSLTALVDGHVDKILVNEGQSVDLHQEIVKIKNVKGI